MRAAQINGYGGKEVIQISADAPQPKIDEQHVLIEVHAASVNAIDWKVRAGYLKENVPLSFPATLGGDIAGVVNKVGGGVTSLKIGDEVFGQGHPLGGVGTFAEFAPAPAATLAKKPASIDFNTAAAIPLTGVSAWQAIKEHIDLQPQQTILIQGAAGGIGSFAVQIAKALGGTVIGTAATEDVEFVRQLGADEVIDYKTQSFENEVKEIDAVFDTVGGETWIKSNQVLREGGVIVAMNGQTDESLAKQYSVRQIAQQTHVTPEKLEQLIKLVEDGKVNVAVDKVFALEETGEALDYVEHGKQRGKVVINMKD
jgi:alcohol dehydrogenase